MNIMEYMEYNEVIGSQMPCRKGEMTKPVCEAWYSISPKVLEELNNAMQRRIRDLIKGNGDIKKY